MKDDVKKILDLIEKVKKNQEKAYKVLCKYEELEAIFLKEKVFFIEGKGPYPFICKDATISEEAKKLIVDIEKILDES